MPMPLEEDIRRPLGSMAHGRAWHEERAWNSQAQKEYRDVIMGNERSPRCEAQYTREQAGPKVDGSEPSLREMSQDAVEAYVRQLRVRQAELQMENEKLRAAVGKFERSHRECAEFFDPPFEPESSDRLLRQNEMLRKILNSIPVMLCFFDAQGDIRMVNDECTRVLGYGPEDMRERNLLELWCPAPEYRRRVWSHFIGAQPGWQDFRIQSKNRGEIVGAWTSIGFPDGTHLAIGMDASLRANARQLRQQAELLDLAHDSIVVHDMAGRVVFWNRGAEQTYGWTKREALGAIGHDLLKTRFPSNLIEITAKLLSQGRWNGELTHVTKDGHAIVVSSRWALQRGEGSEPTGILVIDRDITLQKRAEQATIDARRFAESVTDTVQESLLVLDRTLRVISANQTFYRVFQVPPEETCGQYFYEMADRQWDIPELRSLLEDILPHNTSFEDFEVEHEFATIGRRTMLLNARRIRRQDQDTEMILLAIQDITIRREQQKKIQEHQRELASLTEELLLAEEQERHRIAMVLHDSIGQSLAFSKRELGVLQKQSPENIRAGLEYVKEQIDLAVRQTRDLTFELSPTTLHTFGLEAAVEELAEQFAAREHLRCHFKATEEDKPLTEQTRTLLYRAARELLLNAGKHAQAKNVIIRIDRVDTSVRMVIEDDGKGFDVSQLERNTRREGFGLFSIRERLTHVGGRFAIESHPGAGTKVTLIAPLNREQTVKSRSEKP